MKKGKNKNDKVCGIMKTEKGARNLDKKNFQIQYNSRLCLQGCILAALGILGPTLIAEQRLGIYDDLTMAMMYECSGALISAALKLVCMNVVRMIPHYLGAFLINESVHIYLFGKRRFPELRYIHLQYHEKSQYYESHDKGISKVTLQKIEASMRELEEYADIDMLEESTRIKKKTLYRYLQYLLKEGLVEQEYSYGDMGRPRTLYRWK